MLQRIISSFQANSSEKDADETSGKKASKNAGNGLKPPSGLSSPKTTEENEEAIGRTVFVSQIPLNVLRVDLQRAMEKFGKITSCRMVLDKQTRRFTGKAFVEYEKAGSAKKAHAA